MALTTGPTDEEHREYLILITWPLQKWLQEFALMLRYARITCLVKFLLCGSLGENSILLHNILFFMFSAGAFAENKWVSNSDYYCECS